MALRVLAGPCQVPRSVQDRAQQVIAAALAEVGYPIESVWDEATNTYEHTPYVPLVVLDRARAIACEAVGIPYEWVDE